MALNIIFLKDDSWKAIHYFYTETWQTTERETHQTERVLRDPVPTYATSRAPFRNHTKLNLGFSLSSVCNQEFVSQSGCWVGQMLSSDPKISVFPYGLYQEGPSPWKDIFPSLCWAHKCIYMAVITILCVTKLNNPSFLVSSHKVGPAFPSPAFCPSLCLFQSEIISPYGDHTVYSGEVQELCTALLVLPSHC